MGLILDSSLLIAEEREDFDLTMISNDRKLETTQKRIRQFERQVAQIRKTETNGENYRRSAAGFLADIDRMNLEIRDYLWSLPTERPASAT